LGKYYNRYQPLFIVCVLLLFNRQLISTSLKCRLTVVQLFVITAALCCMDLFTKDLDVAVRMIHLLAG